MGGPTKVTGKFIREKLFTAADEENSLWSCIWITVCKQNETNYSNLVSHVRNKHASGYAELAQDVCKHPVACWITSRLSMGVLFLFAVSAVVFAVTARRKLSAA